MSEEQLSSPDGEPNVLQLRGVVDVGQARCLLDAAAEHDAAAGDVTVDCTEVERLDAAGAQVLLALKARLESQGRALHVVSVPDRVFALLLLTGVGQALVTSSPARSA